MTIIKRLILVTLSLLLMSSGFKIPANAFLTCKKEQCNKKQSLVRSFKRVSIANPFHEIDDSKDDETDDETKKPPEEGDNDDGSTTNDDDGDSEEPSDGGDSELPDDSTNPGPGPSTGGTNPGTGGGSGGGEGGGESCMINIAVLGLAKSFVACQIKTAIRKGNQVLRLYIGLKRRMSNLLRAMKRAPVCTNNGYDLDEFNRDHSITANIKAMRKIIRSMRKLLKELDKISLGCTDCSDDALTAALAAVDAIAKKLAALIVDFKDEMTDADNRFNNFIARLKAVIAVHSTDPKAIQQECNVSFRKARAMSRARLRVLRILDKLIKYKADMDKRIAAINFGSHDCVQGILGDMKLSAACGLV